MTDATRWHAAALIFFGAAHLLASASISRAQGIVETAPPAGFEDLLEERQAQVDVTYEGVNVGSFLATFQPGAIRFADPVALVDALPDVQQRDEIVRALSGDIDTNARRLCGGAPLPDCGVLEPEVAGVIFDVDSFQATLFVAPAFRDAAALDYLPAPLNRPGFVQSFAAAAAGTDSDTQAAVRSFSLFGFGAGRLRADAVADTEEGAAVDLLKGEYDRERWRGEAGLYRVAPLPLLGDRRFLGAGITTTLDTLRDTDQATGSPLSVFLPQRSQVEIYRDGRLLSARSYDGGTQDIYTADLPDGAYLVTLRIVSPGGVREETRFFTKSMEIPPENQPLWRLQAGVLVDDDTDLVPEVGSTPFVHAATRHRIADSFALGGDVLLAEDQQGLGGVLFWLLPEAQLQLEGIATSDDIFGAGLSVRGQWEDFSYSGGVRQIWGGDPPERRRRDRDDDDIIGFALRDPDDLFDAGGTATQVNLAMSYRFDEGPTIGLRGSYFRTVDFGDTYAVGPTLTWPLLRDGRHRLDLHLDATTTDQGEYVLAQLRFSWGNEHVDIVSDAGWSGTVAGEGGAARDGMFGRSSATWHAWEREGERLDLIATASADEEVGAVSGGFDYRGNRGRADANVEHDTRNETRYGANVFFNVVSDPDALALGGYEGRESAVILAVAGPPDARFTVLVDEQPRGTVAGGETLALPLLSFETYDVRIAQTAGGFVDYDASSRTVTLYPGNVRTLEWRAAPVVSLFGQAVAPDGQPLADARFPELRPVGYADAEGWFQVEASAETQDLLLVTPDGGRCRLDLPPLPANENFVDLGQRTCRPLEAS